MSSLIQLNRLKIATITINMVDLAFTLVEIESVITQQLNPDFLALTYGLSDENIRIQIIIADARYSTRDTTEGIKEVIEILRLYKSQWFREYEIIVELYDTENIHEYIKLLKTYE